MNELQKEIIQLKEEKNAIILAHNYQPKEIQEIADFLGDSLELCNKAAEVEDRDIIVFCGVDFMAETAYMLNPDKKVLIPDIDAECPMAHMLPEEELLKACTGFVESHHVYMLQMIRRDIDQTTVLIDELGAKIRDVLSKYDNAIELLKEIPGFSDKVVEDLVAEIGFDMSKFPSEKHLASWAGICPGNNESAGKKKAEESPTETNK